MDEKPQTAQDKLQAFLQAENINIGLVFTTPDGDRISLHRAIKPEYLGDGWQPAIVATENNGDN